jgi:hypothetical protein
MPTKKKTKEVNQFQPQGRVKIVKGSILTPENAGLRFILSVNNLEGKPEGNPMLPLFDKKWKKVREEARGWYATKTGAYKLGAVNTTATQSDTWVIHMLCQDADFKVNAEALETCLDEVCKLAKYERATVHVSTVLTEAIDELPDLLTSCLVNQGVSVTYYEEPDNK